MKRILINNIGYDSSCSKRAVLQSTEPLNPTGFAVVNEATGEEEFKGELVKSAPVARWNKGDFWCMDFSEFAPNKDVNYSDYYFLRVTADEGTVESAPFQIYGSVIEFTTVSSVVYYFKGQRATGEWEEKDRRIGFRGTREGTVDVHGGWFDATGDVGVHLTHQSHTTWFNPQQASLSAHVFYRLLDLLKENSSPWYNIYARRLLDEATFGADWLMRLRTERGTFFKSGTGRNNAYEPTEKNRQIGFEYRRSSRQFGKAATADEEVVTDEYYESSFRAGGGYAIAALAAAARYPYPSAEYSGMEYLNAARDSYFYLEEHNAEYTNDGGWNLVDTFTALDAAVELYKSSGEVGFLNRARTLAEDMEKRYVAVNDNSGYLAVDDGDRPYFSATDEGTPIVALLNYCGIERDKARKKAAVKLAEQVMRYALQITNEVDNPFGYARIYYQLPDGKRGTQFFFPHTTEMAPWWQGDNARILSLSAAARYTASYTEDEELKKALSVYADDQINWVLGLNPYDTCMVEGYGHRNIDYFFQFNYDFISAPGGIVNGITGGIDDEEGIEFVMKPTDNPEIVDNWRWAEQWLPHASWYLYALALKKI